MEDPVTQVLWENLWEKPMASHPSSLPGCTHDPGQYADTATAHCGFVYSGFYFKHLNLSKDGKGDNVGHLL